MGGTASGRISIDTRVESGGLGPTIGVSVKRQSLCGRYNRYRRSAEDGGSVSIWLGWRYLLR